MRTWTTPDGLVFEDEQTGDGRLFVPGALYWDEAPNGWPLRYAPTDEGGHFGAELVGAIGTLTRNGSAITSTGQLDDDIERGAEAARLLDEGNPLGVSVDLDDMEVEFVLSDPEQVDDEPVVLLAASLPHGTVHRRPGALGLEAPGLRPLLASAGLAATVAAAGEGDPEDGIVLWTDSMDEVIMRVTRGRIRGATLVDMPAFDRAAIALDGTATETTGDDDAEDAEQALAAAGGCTPCLAAEVAATVAASGHSSRVPVAPPRQWFRRPADYDRHVIEVTDPMTGRTLRGVPMQYRDTGQVFGHIALWGQCHTGSNGECVMTPRSASALTWFHHGQVLTAEGDTLAVGNLTCGGGHADVMLSYRAALEHYDNVSSMHAQLVAIEDELGVFVMGAGMPDVWADDIRMRRLRGASPSGDWRPIGGAQELTIAHAVCGPGFPVPRARVASSGRVEAMVAASGYEVGLLNRRAQGASESDVEGMLTRAVAAGIAAFRADEDARAEAAERRAARARLRALDPDRQAALARLRG